MEQGIDEATLDAMEEIDENLERDKTLNEKKPFFCTAEDWHDAATRMDWMPPPLPVLVNDFMAAERVIEFVGLKEVPVAQWVEKVRTSEKVLVFILKWENMIFMKERTLVMTYYEVWIGREKEWLRETSEGYIPKEYATPQTADELDRKAKFARPDKALKDKKLFPWTAEAWHKGAMRTELVQP
ncbi:hypothetical protein BDV19DRAFT_386691 [Aspergillus venezuelensis]